MQDPPDDRPLPRGRHALPRHVIDASQRKRMLDALMTAAAQHGLALVRVGDICRLARVSRATFYEHFPNRSACWAALEGRELSELEASFSRSLRRTGSALSAFEAVVVRLCDRPEVLRSIFANRGPEVRGPSRRLLVTRSRLTHDLRLHIGAATSDAHVTAIIFLALVETAAGEDEWVELGDAPAVANDVLWCLTQRGSPADG